jgi:hypothetical protein
MVIVEAGRVTSNVLVIVERRGHAEVLGGVLKHRS